MDVTPLISNNPLGRLSLWNHYTGSYLDHNCSDHFFVTIIHDELLLPCRTATRAMCRSFSIQPQDARRWT